MSAKSFSVAGESGKVEASLSLPPKTSATGQVFVICHGLPLSTGGGSIASKELPALAERFSAEAGWAVAVASLRGVGASPGTFSASGWKADLKAVIDALAPDYSGVVLAGFGFGGALALRVGAEDERVRGVATLATPSNLATWCGPAAQFAEACNRAGVVQSDALMEPDVLVADVLALDPLGATQELPPKRLMIIHGADDPIVPVSATRELLDAAQGRAEVRIIQGAGHWLRADPRMVATLLGWLDRLR